MHGLAHALVEQVAIERCDHRGQPDARGFGQSTFERFMEIAGPDHAVADVLRHEAARGDPRRGQQRERVLGRAAGVEARAGELAREFFERLGDQVGAREAALLNPARQADRRVITKGRANGLGRRADHDCHVRIGLEQRGEHCRSVADFADRVLTNRLAIDMVVKARDPQLAALAARPPIRAMKAGDWRVVTSAMIEAPTDQLALIGGARGDEHGEEIDLRVIGQPEQRHEIVGVRRLHLEDHSHAPAV